MALRAASRLLRRALTCAVLRSSSIPAFRCMLTVVPSPAAFIHIRASGRLSARDYDRFEPEFTAELKRRNVPALRLLLDIRGFRGWTPGGFTRDLRWDFRNRRTFSKIAVIGDRSWHRWIAAAGKPLFRAPMRYFDEAQEAEGERWLGG